MDGKFDMELMENSLKEKPSVDAPVLDAMNRMTSYGLGLKQLGKAVLDPTDNCWNTGNFTDECDCALCDHKDECSGNDREDDD